MSCYIAAYGLVSALGAGRDASAEALKAWHDAGVSPLDRHRAPLLGEHTDEVLDELGYSAGQVAQLRADGIV